MVRTVNVTYVSSCSAGPPGAYLVPNVFCCSAFCCSVLFCLVLYANTWWVSDGTNTYSQAVR